jgi:Predicted hydrolases of the HAD superfamily
MLPMISEELHTATFIGCNGGMAYQGGVIKTSHTLRTAFVEQVVQHLTTLGIPYVLDGEWSFSFSKHTHRFHDYIRSLSSEEVSEQDLMAEGVTKILLLSDEHKASVMTLIKAEDVSVHTHRSDGFYDITPQGNNKYRALSELIGSEKYTAFGNDQNDFIMLNNAEIAVFIGEEKDFPHATYYIEIDDIPELIAQLESNAHA